MNKYAKDKLLRLLSRNGNPDTSKIRQLFNKIDKDNSSFVSALELRVLLLELNMDDDDLRTARDVQNILESFDVSEDGLINQDEFVKGMTKLVHDLSDQNPDCLKIRGGSNPQVKKIIKTQLRPQRVGLQYGKYAISIQVTDLYAIYTSVNSDIFLITIFLTYSLRHGTYYSLITLLFDLIYKLGRVHNYFLPNGCVPLHPLTINEVDITDLNGSSSESSCNRM